jgi:hypothetical protein
MKGTPGVFGGCSCPKGEKHMSQMTLAEIAKEMAGIDIAVLAVEGTAELIREKSAFQQHWTSDLDKWFDNGIDTPGIVLIKVKAQRITYWKGQEEGEVRT